MTTQFNHTTFSDTDSYMRLRSLSSRHYYGAVMAVRALSAHTSHSVVSTATMHCLYTAKACKAIQLKSQPWPPRIIRGIPSPTGENNTAYWQRGSEVDNKMNEQTLWLWPWLKHSILNNYSQIEDTVFASLLIIINKLNNGANGITLTDNVHKRSNYMTLSSMNHKWHNFRWQRVDYTIIFSKDPWPSSKTINTGVVTAGFKRHVLHAGKYVLYPFSE